MFVYGFCDSAHFPSWKETWFWQSRKNTMAFVVFSTFFRIACLILRISRKNTRIFSASFLKGADIGESMKKSTLKRIQRRLNNLPKYFVDSSVFIEALFQQERTKECRSFFHKAGLKYRIFTSTVVMGEVLKAINRLPSAEAKEEEMHLLADMLKSLDIAIMAVSFACISNVEAVRFSDSYLGSSDCIIFSSAVTENCNAFITLDPDFTEKLGADFHMRIKKPE